MDTTENSLRALFIEDSENDALLNARTLERGGYRLESTRVEDAAGMREALTKPWDVIIADFMMPQFTALDALAILKEQDLDIPFIVVSGTVGEDVAVEAMRAGASDYFRKEHLERLVPAVEREIRAVSERKKRKEIEGALQFRIKEVERLAELLAGKNLEMLGMKEAQLKEKLDEPPKNS